jgi:hypothetical protein
MKARRNKEATMGMVDKIIEKIPSVKDVTVDTAADGSKTIRLDLEGDTGHLELSDVGDNDGLLGVRIVSGGIADGSVQAYSLDVSVKVKVGDLWGVD